MLNEPWESVEGVNPKLHIIAEKFKLAMYNWWFDCGLLPRRWRRMAHVDLDTPLKCLGTFAGHAKYPFYLVAAIM